MGSRNPYPEEVKQRARELEEQGWGRKRIAAELGVGSSTVVYWLNHDAREKQRKKQATYRREVRQPRRRALAGTGKPKTCSNCGESFTPAGTSRQLYCDECRRPGGGLKPTKKKPPGANPPRARRSPNKSREVQRASNAPEARSRARRQINPALALSIDERVRKRIAALTKEEEKEARAT